MRDDGAAEPWLARAVELAAERGTVIVAAAGNEGCRCLHVPAALPSVLAVGACDGEGRPLPGSNWGDVYRSQGVLAPGDRLLGAAPGGGTARLTGSSAATPVVSGALALLASLVKERGEDPALHSLRELLLSTSRACSLGPNDDPGRCLVGRMNIQGALEALTGETMSEEAQQVQASGCACGGAGSCSCQNHAEVEPSAEARAGSASAHSSSPARAEAAGVLPSSTVSPSSGGAGSLVYAIGILGYDFGTEARRDSFKQLMPPFSIDGTQVPAVPYDARQMADYLKSNLSEACSLIWTLNVELTPIYAIEAQGPFARDVYQALSELLADQVIAEREENYVERVSIPGYLTGRHVRLFSGQVVPIVSLENPRGLYGWKVNALIDAALSAAVGEGEGERHEAARRSLQGFLHRVYYDLRNLGQLSQDRALNFAATNAFQAAHTVSSAVGAGMELDAIEVEKSPFCRMDSDCWDVKLKFFDPENDRRAKKVFRFTIDVSDQIPVTLGEIRSWSTPY